MPRRARVARTLLTSDLRNGFSSQNMELLDSEALAQKVSMFRSVATRPAVLRALPADEAPCNGR